eukprot:11699122-Prorocentrum_lima.AAC.1
MTSSLVGSEMCIRDRSWKVHLIALHAVQSRTPPMRCSPGHSSWLPPLPVSYTHLTLPTICSV